MTPREWFDVFVRVVGVVVLVYGLWDLVNGALFYTDYWRNPDMSFRFYLISGWASIFIGLLMIRAAAVLVNFAYPLEVIEPEAQNDDTAESETSD